MEIYKDIKGEKLKKIFEKLNKIADMASIERYCTEKIPEDEFTTIQNEYKKYILENDKNRRKSYTNNINDFRKRLKSHLGIKTEKEATRYFDTLLNQDIEDFNCLKNNGEIREIAPIEEDVIRKKYTRVTPTTSGPIRQLYYIRIGELLNKIESNMDSLFAFPYIINNEQYENIAFYKQNKPIFAVCSHENFACVMLDDEDIEELKKIGIQLKD